MFYRIENIPDESNMQAVVAELLPLVPFVRREKALRYKHLHGQYCCLRAWQLLHELIIEHHLLPVSFPLADLTYTEDEYGKPVLSASIFERSSILSMDETVCFSISHTKNALAVAVSVQPVGIDIESMVSVRRAEDAAFLQRTMSPAELQRIASAEDSSMCFTELWTRKEAVFKAMGTGIDLSTLPTVLEMPHPYSLRSFCTNDYVCSIAWLG